MSEAASGRRKTLQIDGMHCAGCAQAVERALQAVEGVADAGVDLINERAFVDTSSDVSDAVLIAAVRAAGYKAARGTGPRRRTPLWSET